MKITIEMSKNLSNNLTYFESVKSYTAARFGIDNTPTLEQIIVMRFLAQSFFQPLRDFFKVRIFVSSFFRSVLLNRKLKGAKNSDHMILGKNPDTAAIDIDDTYSREKGIYNRDFFKYIFENMDYHKLIWEFDDELTPDGLPSPRWCHISVSMDPKKNKQKITLYAKKVNGKTQYFKFSKSKAQL